MITIFHNPRCRKSREGLELIENSGQDYEVVYYLKHPLSKSQLKTILAKLNITPIELVRTNESIWKEQYKGQSLDDDAVLNAMVTHPKLIERPIVMTKNKAIIGRPPENILTII
jgi:arsenate reductase